jgi:hypothetical protein
MPEELMPEEKAFVVVQIAINDRDKYHQYETAGHLEIFDKFGGKLGHGRRRRHRRGQLAFHADRAHRVSEQATGSVLVRIR